MGIDVKVTFKSDSKALLGDLKNIKKQVKDALSGKFEANIRIDRAKLNADLQWLKGKLKEGYSVTLKPDTRQIEAYLQSLSSRTVNVNLKPVGGGGGGGSNSGSAGGGGGGGRNAGRYDYQSYGGSPGSNRVGPATDNVSAQEAKMWRDREKEKQKIRDNIEAQKRASYEQMGVNARLRAGELDRADKANESARVSRIQQTGTNARLIADEMKRNEQANEAARRASIQQTGTNAKLIADEMKRNDAAAEKARIARIQQTGTNAKLIAGDLARKDAAAEEARVQSIKDMGDRARLIAEELGRKDKAAEDFTRDSQREAAKVRARLERTAEKAGINYAEYRDLGRKIAASPNANPQDVREYARMQRKMSNVAAKEAEAAEGGKYNRLASLGFSAAFAMHGLGEAYDVGEKMTGAAYDRITDPSGQLNLAYSALGEDFRGVKGLLQSGLEGIGLMGNSGLSGDRTFTYTRQQKLELLNEAKRYSDASEGKIALNRARSAEYTENRFLLPEIQAQLKLASSGGTVVGNALEDAKFAKRLNDLKTQEEAALKGSPERLNTIRSLIAAETAANIQRKDINERNAQALDLSTYLEGERAKASARTAGRESLNIDRRSQLIFGQQSRQADIKVAEELIKLEPDLDKKKRMQFILDSNKKADKDLTAAENRQYDLGERDIAKGFANELASLTRKTTRSFFQDALRSIEEELDKALITAKDVDKPAMRKIAEQRKALVLADLRYSTSVSRQELSAQGYAAYGNNVAATRIRGAIEYNRAVKEIGGGKDLEYWRRQAKLFPGTQAGREASAIADALEAARAQRDFNNGMAKRDEDRQVYQVTSQTQSMKYRREGRAGMADLNDILSNYTMQEDAYAGNPRMLRAIKLQKAEALRRFVYGDGQPKIMGMDEYYDSLQSAVFRGGDFQKALDEANRAEIQANGMNDADANKAVATGKAIGDVLAEKLKEIFGDLKSIFILGNNNNN